jgi:tetratricopeptide (TPR) repeat protein
MRVCNAIAFAHSKKTIHLDLKPENVQVGDYGEVLVLDWGLAKIIGKDQDNPDETEDQEKEKHTPRQSPELTLDGVTKGTPGYMAPEQAAGRNSEKDERTDIYSLGALLYAILTWTNPYEGEDIEQLLHDTVNGNLIPPKLRKPKMFIPSALEAVVMKAMAVHPSQRYQTVNEMREDVLAFMGGFATSAERASLFKKSVLLVKRHRVASAFLFVILAMLLFLGIYAVRERSRQTADWISVYKADFTGPDLDFKGLVFTDNLIKEKVQPWMPDSDGLKMERQNWLWLENTKVNDNIKLVIKMICRGTVSPLEVCLNSRMQPVKRWWHTPAGYSFQFGGDGGSKDMILKNEEPGASDIISAAETMIHPDHEYTLTIQKKGEDLSVYLDGNQSLKVIDLFPPIGLDFNRIGIRTHSPLMWLKSIEVHRLALPEKSSPLIAGDTLAELQHFEESIEKYLTIAENYGTSPVAEQALTRAYITAATKLNENKSKYLFQIKKEINTKFPKFRYNERILEIDALVHWRNGEYEKALKLVREIFEINTYTNVVLRILQCQHNPLPEEIGNELMLWISRTKNLKRLNISNLGIKSLHEIKDLSLVFLDCSSNKVQSLRPLENLYLETLFCEKNQIKSLEPLKEMALKDLNCANNEISNLEPLKNMPLKMLDCSKNKIYSLDPLEFVPLEKLECHGNLLLSLDSLKKLSLKYLDCSKNQIQSLDVLSEMPLENLICYGNLISDLTPLASSNLSVLNCANNLITTLEPLRSLALTSLNCSKNKISNLEPISSMLLENLNCAFNPIRSIEPIIGMPLKSLNLEGCNDLYDISSLSQLRELEYIKLPGQLMSAEVIKNLPKLKNQPSSGK